MSNNSLSYFQRLKNPVLLVMVFLSLFALFCTADAKRPKFKKVYTLKHALSPSSVTVLNDEQVLIKMGAAGEVYNYKENSSFPAVSFYMGEYGILGGGPYYYTITPLSKSKSIILGTSGCNKKNLEKCKKVTAAIYDVQKNTIEPLSKWFPTRERHTATLLKNGKILIVGGIGNRFDVEKGLMTEKERLELADIILLDPETLDYKVVGQLSQNRFNHSTLQIDENRFLIAGGETNDPDYPKVESWEINNNKLFDTIELFDLSTGKSKTIGHVEQERIFPKLIKLNTKEVLISSLPILIFNPEEETVKTFKSFRKRALYAYLSTINKLAVYDYLGKMALFDMDSKTFGKSFSVKFKDEKISMFGTFVTPQGQLYAVMENNLRKTNEYGAYIYKLKQ